MKQLARDTGPDLNIRRFDFGSADYLTALALRERVLRQPLGRTLSPADTEGEGAQLHFGAFAADELLACVTFKPLAAGHAKLRQMAVAEAARGCGVGRSLIVAAETLVHEHGIQQVELSARHSAQGFYRKLSYRECGPYYLELNLPHILMKKTLMQKTLS